MIDEVNDNDEKCSLSVCFKRMTDKTKSAMTCKNLTKRLPILQWLPIYTSEDCIGDLLAGFTVGLTLIPQSMSFAALAGLPPQVKKKKSTRHHNQWRKYWPGERVVRTITFNMWWYKLIVLNYHKIIKICFCFRKISIILWIFFSFEKIKIINVRQLFA